MKISVNAGELATALALAARCPTTNATATSRLEAVRLAAADDELTIAADVLDFASPWSFRR